MRNTWLKDYPVLHEEGPKEHRVHFYDHEVRATLDGTKTQMRRIIKPQPDFDSAWKNLGGAERFGEVFGMLSDNSELIPKIDLTQGHITLRSGNGYGYTNPNIKVKYAPGDSMWVRETWQPNPWPMGEPYFYRATDGNSKWGPWKPSIFMPRAASRITLAITEVRVERLQSITEADALAEGVLRWSYEGDKLAFANYTFKYSNDPACYFDPRQSFQSLWEKINGANSWAANPWVWAITFKVIQP